MTTIQTQERFQVNQSARGEKRCYIVFIEAILIKRCGIYSSIDEFRQHRKTIDVGMVL